MALRMDPKPVTWALTRKALKSVVTGLCMAMALVVVAPHGAARALFIYDISITGGFTASGQISFATSTGFFQPVNDSTNLVTDFSLTVTAQDSFVTTSAGSGPPPPLPFTFDLSTVSTFSWSIDLVDQSLSLFLITFGNRVIIENVVVAYSISIDTLGFDGGQRFIQVDCFTGVFRPDAPAAFCSSALEPTGRFSTGSVQFSAVEIPEPSTLGLFVSGLAGLGFVGLRRRRSVQLKAT